MQYNSCLNGKWQLGLAFTVVRDYAKLSSTRCQFQYFTHAFFVRKIIAQLFLVMFWLCRKRILAKKALSYKKRSSKMLMKLTTGNTVYKWAGSDYRRSRKNLACLPQLTNFLCLQKQLRFSSEPTVEILLGTLFSFPWLYGSSYCN